MESGSTQTKRSINLCFLGADVGKSSIIKRFLQNEYDESYQQTYVETYKYEASYKGTPVELHIVDIGSALENSSALEERIGHADILVLVYSLMSQRSIIYLQAVHHKIENILMPSAKGHGHKILLVGNGYDDPEKASAKLIEDGQILADCFGTALLLVSAKTGENVPRIFEEAVKNSFEKAAVVEEAIEQKRGLVTEVPLGKALKKATYYLLSSTRIRHVSLQGDRLYCSTDEFGTHHRLIVSLIGANINMENRDGHNFVRIRTAEGISYGFYSDSDQETKSWLEALAGATVKNHVFGAPLDKYVASTKEPISLVVKKCIDFLNRMDAHKIEGIFRVPGSVNAIVKLRNEFNERLQGIEIPSTQDTFAVANLLKQYLRDLPEPIFSHHLHMALYRIQRESPNLIDRCASYAGALRNLPRVYFSTIKYLLWYLHEIHSNQQFNKMTATNLAIMLGPNVFRSPSTSPIDMIESLKTQVQTLRDLIENFEIMFPQQNVDEFEIRNPLLFKVLRRIPEKDRLTEKQPWTQSGWLVQEGLAFNRSIKPYLISCTFLHRPIHKSKHTSRTDQMDKRRQSSHAAASFESGSESDSISEKTQQEDIDSDDGGVGREHNTEAKQESVKDDSEIKAIGGKKRLKLTHDLLMAPNGLPQLQKTCQGLHLKGPGFERDNLKTILRVYEEWGASIFPKLAFPDLLTQIRNTGRNKDIKLLVSCMKDGKSPDEMEKHPVSSFDEAYLDTNDGPSVSPPESPLNESEIPQSLTHTPANDASNSVKKPSIPPSTVVSESTSVPAAPPVTITIAQTLTAEQIARMEKNRQEALMRFQAKRRLENAN